MSSMVYYIKNETYGWILENKLINIKIKSLRNKMVEYHSILIPVTGCPQEKIVKMEDVEKLLNCETCDHMSLSYLDWFGYRLLIFVDDFGVRKNLAVNPLASFLVKEKGPIYGPILLVDDYKKLTMDDFRIILTIMKIIPFTDWKPYRPEISTDDSIWTELNRNLNKEHKLLVKRTGIDEKEILKKVWKYIPDEIKNDQLKKC